MEYDFSNLTDYEKKLLTFQGWHPKSIFIRKPNKRNIKKLVCRGLLVERRVNFKTGFRMPYLIYEVPLDAHHAWCKKCDEDNK